MASSLIAPASRSVSMSLRLRLLSSLLLLILFVLAATAPTSADDSSSTASSNTPSQPQSCAATTRTDDSSASCTDHCSDSNVAQQQQQQHVNAAAAIASPPHQQPYCTTVTRDAAKQKHVVFVSIAIKGHAQPLLRIASAMQARGYRVSFATHESGKDWATAARVPFISAGPFPISADDLRTKLKAMTRDASTFRGILTMVNDIYVAAARPMFDALLLQLREDPPDLFIYDIATLGAQDLAQHLQVPSIINSPSLLFDVGGTPSYVPAWGTGYSIDMSLWQRCLNLLFPRLLSVALTPPFMQLNKARVELALAPYRSQHDVFKRARVLLNTAVGLEHAQPLAPRITAVGPILPAGSNASIRGSSHQVQSSSSSSSLHTWLDASRDAGVVYLNLGTLAYIDAWQAQALIDGLLFRQLHYRIDPLSTGPVQKPLRVLWVLPTDQRNVLPTDVPSNLKVKSPSGVANNDILAHAAVRLVVSHCGCGAAQEALVAHKPLLCIPFVVDQPDVAARVVDAGAGLVLDKNALRPIDVHHAAMELLMNESYTHAARRVGRLLALAGGTDRAIDVIDAELRVGSRHLATYELEAPWHKAAMLDVWTVYAAVVCLLAFAVRIHWLVLYYVATEALALVSSAVLGPPTPVPAAAAKTAVTGSAGDGSSDAKDTEASLDATESESSEVPANE